jgi:hypothetical protein
LARRYTVATALELLRERRYDELWQRCCGFTDLSLQQYMDIQRSLLLEQIGVLGRCELGRKLMKGFTPASVEEFRRDVPLTTYADYVPYLSEKVEDALPEKPLLWQRTSGRSGQFVHKWAPVTGRQYRELGELQLGIALIASCRDRRDITIDVNDKALYGLAPPPYASGCWARRVDEEGVFEIIPPIDRAEKMDFQERIAEGFKIAMTRGIDVMFAIGSVLVAIGNQLDRGGSAKDMLPLLKRPRLLYRILRGKAKAKLAGRKMLPKDLWKLKALVSSGTDSNVYREKIREQWGRYPLDAYGVTEGVVIATQLWDYGDMTFIPNINFLEFIPLDEYKKWAADRDYQPQVLTLDELVPDRKYVTVITNFLGGPYVRYVLDDIVTITALRNERLNVNTPQMTFYGRASDIIDFTYAFLTEKTIWQAVEETGIPYADFVVRKETSAEGTPILRVYIEPIEGAHLNEDEAARLLHEKLKQLNEDYPSVEALFGKQPVKVTSLAPGSFGRYTDRMRQAGADLAHLKPPRMNPPDEILATLRSHVPAAEPEPAEKKDGVRTG